ncbi:MAG: hypothetical protein RLZ32_1934 [Gemmatimonadota bacterium]
MPSPDTAMPPLVLPRRRPWARLLLRPLALAALVAACSGGDAPVAPADSAGAGSGGPSAATTGTLVLIIDGVPPGARGDVVVTGPNGFSRTAQEGGSWPGLALGTYTITTRPIRTAAGLFGRAGAPQQLQLTGAGGTATVAYAPVPATLEVTVNGLPASVAVPLVVSRPTGADTTLGTARTLAGPAGRWRVTAATLVEASTRFAPAPSLIDTTLRYGDTARVTMRFVPVTGALAVSIGGLPAGMAGQVEVRGPDGFNESLTVTRTLTLLTPGRYRVVTRPLAVDGIAYRGAVDSTEVLVEPSITATPAPVLYAAQVGSLRLETTGLVAGTTVPVTVSGNGISRSLTAPGRVDSLPVGSYTLTVAPTTVSGYRYAPLSTTVGASVTPGQTTGVTLAYEVLPTILDVFIEGLDASTSANVTLIAPSGERFTPVRSQRFLQAVPGTWTLRADTVTSLTARHAATPDTGRLQLAPGDTGRFAVQYTLATGMLAVAVTGTPSESPSPVTVTGPEGYRRVISGTTTLTHLRPGTYTVEATTFVVEGLTYTPATPLQQVLVAPSAVAAGVSVFYSAPIGEVVLSASGLPPGATPSFTLTGPVSRSVQGAGRVSGLPTGAYTITATPVMVEDLRYEPSPATVTATVTNGGAVPVAFSYVARSDAPNLKIQNVMVVQAVQTAAGDVPLVAGRHALVRVFVTANTDGNNYLPRVTVLLSNASGTVLLNQQVQWHTAGVPTFVDGTRYDATMNVVVDSALIKPGVRLLVELDPRNLTNDARSDDNVWPRGGTPLPLPVAVAPPFEVRFVPVTVGALTGNVSSSNLEQYLALTRQLLPINEVQTDVAPPFTTSVTALDATGVGPWSQVLSELNAARTANGAPANQYYYGVIKVGYNAGIAGVGYVPGRTALGWDDGGSAAGVAAHEWGHNFGRNHAPCGTSGDAQYPYSGGIIGHLGWVPRTGTIVPQTATDIMGYCDNTWVSDYTWNAVLAYRQSTSAPLRAGVAADGLLVWGRVRNGQVVLEPAFRVRAPLTPAPVSGTHRLELLTETGTALGTYRLQAQTVDHGAPGEQHFAAIVPYSAATEQALATIRVSDVRTPLRSAQRTAPTGAAIPMADDPSTAATAVARGVQPRWTASRVAMAMVRDAGTGEVLGFVRDAGRTVATGGRRVEVVFSDGVRSTVKRPE